jgi:hypothetical protein
MRVKLYPKIYVPNPTCWDRSQGQVCIVGIFRNLFQRRQNNQNRPVIFKPVPTEQHYFKSPYNLTDYISLTPIAVLLEIIE